jgi:hypothetical protein
MAEGSFSFKFFDSTDEQNQGQQPEGTTFSAKEVPAAAVEVRSAGACCIRHVAEGPHTLLNQRLSTGTGVCGGGIC